MRYDGKSTDTDVIYAWLSNIGNARYKRNIRRYLSSMYRDLLAEGKECCKRGHARDYVDYIKEHVFDKMTRLDVVQMMGDVEGDMTLDKVRYYVAHGHKEELDYLVSYFSAQAEAEYSDD